VEEESISADIGGSATLSQLPTPSLCYSLDVNALNYCRFSLLSRQESNITSKDEANDASQALIAVPNLVESDEVHE
jgi:ASTRA-associated protein 1